MNKFSPILLTALVLFINSLAHSQVNEDDMNPYHRQALKTKPTNILIKNESLSSSPFTLNIDSVMILRENGEILKHIFSYDSVNRIGYDITEIINESELSRKVYHFNEQNKVDSILYEEKDSDNWIFILKQIFNYDLNDNMIMRTTGGSKWIYEYDDKGNLLSETYIWKRNGQWENRDRDRYEYNSSDLITNMYLDYWEDDSWKNVLSYTYNYDNENKLVELLIHRWEQNDWKNHEKHTYKYDTSGNLISELTQRWNENSWEDFVLSTKNYNESNEITYYLRQLWDNSSSTWVNDYAVEYEYYSTNKIETELSQTWIEKDDGYWYPQNKITYSYDTRDNISQYKKESWSGSEWYLTDDTYHYGDNFSLYYFRGAKIDFYYPYTITGLPETDRKQLDFYLSQNYPNPFNPTTTIDFSLPQSGFVELTVYNLLGEKFTTLINGYKTEGNHSIKFNGGNLSSGVYLYKIKTDKLSIVKKMLLVK